MNEVKLVARTLDLFEVFAAEQRPLALNQLARLLDVPMSSCLALIRTLVGRGYLIEVRKRGRSRRGDAARIADGAARCQR
jgi:DNA-binding IclR family transcriptional regulator